MNILVACEFSGRVRDAFRTRGHDAVSCDLLPSDAPGPHIQGDAIQAIRSRRWDLVIAFPPCTHLCASGARWWKSKATVQAEAIAFVEAIVREAHLAGANIAIENPVGILSRVIGKPSQIIQPWQFGHGETKATCLWLWGLLPLVPTNIVDGREARVHRMSPGPHRAKMRSLTYQGIADAMAAQWG